MTRFANFLHEELDALLERDLLRVPPSIPDTALVLCSNDYLGYATDPLPAAAISPTGAGASRLVSGDHAAHRRAEQAIADWLRCESSLLMSSGYAANVGVVTALTSADDTIVSDAHNHASIIDGCRLSRATVTVVPHLDLRATETALAQARGAKRRWLITESLFSMDGDAADLPALRELADRYDAFLIVDEAHAIGLFGEEGRGLASASGVRPDVLVGTLGKSLGLSGAFVAGSAALRSLLWNRARSFVFSTGVSPCIAAAAAERVERVRTDDAGRERLREIETRFRDRLMELGAPIAPSLGPIIPWHVGDDAAVLTLRDRLLELGVFCQAIRPPTVSEGSARLRITLHARLTDEQLERALAAFAQLI